MLKMILLLVTASLATSADQHSITATQGCTLGTNCTLNCVTGEDALILNVKWTREDFNPNVVYLFRDGQPSNGQNLQFKNRVRLSPKELQNGNAALTITNVTQVDEGNYTCTVISPARYRQRRAAKSSLTVKLMVNDPAPQNDIQNKEEPHNTHSGAMLPVILTIVGLIAVAVSVVGLVLKRRGFLKRHHSAKVPTEEKF